MLKYIILFLVIIFQPAEIVYSSGFPLHPLDSLTSDEYKTIVLTLAKENYIDRNSRFPQITLNESSKKEVLSWKPGEEFQRKAFVIIKKGKQTFESVVDIRKKKVESWVEVKGVQAGFLLTEEWLFVQRLVRTDPKIIETLKKRGFTNLNEVVLIPHTVGYYGNTGEENNRVVKVTFYDSRGINNFWGRPIEGLIATFDLNQKKVIELIDLDKPSIKYENRVDFSKIEKTDNNKSYISEHSISNHLNRNGNIFKWLKWKFHFKIDPRLGPVFSLVEHLDNEKYRSILYQGSLSELYVPYMDPDPAWYFKTYMDAGEYGLGKLSSKLIETVDCSDNSYFIDTEFINEWGIPYKVEKAACIFERNTGDILWRHHEAVNQITESRRAKELVVRFVSSIGSYDYIFDWIFRQDGSINISVQSTGVPQVKGVSKKDSNHGNLVDKNLMAVNHDHYFSFRLDLDTDGTENSFQIDRLKPKKIDKNSLRKSVWIVEPYVAQTESEAKLKININNPAKWRIINPNNINELGNAPGYQLKPKGNAAALLDPDEYPQKRAGFIKHNLWVTPYRPDKIYSAGTYTNQSKGDDGLNSWTEANRSIENKDIVLWYTLGMHHVVRSEDWPVMPTVKSEFELRPFNFFSRNPALDIN